jgi:ribosomal-protein-alanine N-acetyltransferase
VLSSHQPAPDSPQPQRPVLRPALITDIPAIIAFEKSAPSAAHWRESAYRDIFTPSSPSRICIVLEEESEVHHHLLGFVVARVARPDCELENVVVDHQFQRRGFGKQLLHALTSAARAQNATRIFLEVRESNSAARALYENCGFTITGRRLSYYTAPAEDAVLYALQL